MVSSVPHPVIPLKSPGVLPDVHHSLRQSFLTCSTSLPECNKSVTSDVLSLISSSLSPNLRTPSTFTIAINILKAQIIQLKHRVHSLELENEELRHANSVYHSDLSSLNEELRKLRSDYYQELDHRRRRVETLKDDTTDEIRSLKSRLAEANVFIQAVVDLRLGEPVFNGAAQAFDAGCNAEEAFVRSIMAASTRQCSPWSRIVPRVVGPRSAEEYLSSVHLSLKARKEVYDHQIMSTSGDLRAQAGLVGCQITGHSAVQLSNICAEMLSEIDLPSPPVTLNGNSAPYEDDNPAHRVKAVAIANEAHEASSVDLDVDSCMTVNLQSAGFQALPAPHDEGEVQPKDSDDEALADRIKNLKKTKSSQQHSKLLPEPSLSLQSQSKKLGKASTSNKSPVTPSRPKAAVRKTGACETPHPGAHPSPPAKLGGSSLKNSSHRKTPKASPSASPIRSRLSTPRTNTFKRPSAQKASSDGTKNVNKEGSKRVIGAATASSKTIGRDVKKRRGVIMVRKDSIGSPAEQIQEVSATSGAEIRLIGHPVPASGDVFVVECGSKYREQTLDRDKTVEDDIRERSNISVCTTFLGQQIRSEQAIVPLPSETAIARLVEAFSDSDLGSLELSDNEASSAREHIRLVFQGSADEISGNSFTFPSIRRSLVKEVDAQGTVSGECVVFADQLSRSPCDEADSTPLARSRPFFQPDTPTPAPRSVLLSGSGSEDSFADADEQNFDRTGATVGVFATPTPSNKFSSAATARRSNSERNAKNSMTSFSNGAVSDLVEGLCPVQDQHPMLSSFSKPSTDAEMRIIHIPKKLGGSGRISLPNPKSTSNVGLHSCSVLRHPLFESEPPTTDRVIIIGASSVVDYPPLEQSDKDTLSRSQLPPRPVRAARQTPQMVITMPSLPATPPRPRAESLTEAGSPSQFTTKARSNTIDLYLPTPQSPLSRLLSDFSAESKSRSRAGSLQSSSSRRRPPPSSSREKPVEPGTHLKGKARITKPVLPLRITKKSSSNKSKHPPTPPGSLSSSAAIPLMSSTPIPRAQRVTSTAVSLIPNWTTTPTKNGALTPLQSRKLFNNSMSMAFR